MLSIAHYVDSFPVIFEGQLCQVFWFQDSSVCMISNFCYNYLLILNHKILKMSANCEMDKQ